MKEKVDEMQIENKDVIVVIGPSRSGKGTLLAALEGVKMGLVCAEDQEGEEFENAAVNMVMAPIDANGKAVNHEMISHGSNSHTL